MPAENGNSRQPCLTTSACIRSETDTPEDLPRTPEAEAEPEGSARTGQQPGATDSHHSSAGDVGIREHCPWPLFIAAAATAGLLLSACGAETSGTATPGSTEATTTTAGSKETSTPTASPVAGGDTTAPGTGLKVDARAVIPYASGEKKGTIAVTLTAIDPGAKEDLAKFGDKAKNLTPFCLRVQIENLSGTDLSYTSVSLRGLGADGKGTGVIITGETAKCESGSAPKAFSTAGAEYETCVLSAAPDGSKVAAPAYDRGDGCEKSPVIWES